ncbi:SH3 domain-containing protein [Streptomyces sp. NPDC093546]|uniref:SH3 domain-containing protein n=1 Tax=Streptomyces sp. NPDC093546 TaxID=3366040 RepID=UPI0038066DAA
MENTTETTGTIETTETAGAAETAATAAFAAADVVRYPIAPGHRVNVRSGPGTQYRIIRTLPYDVRVPVYCQKPGERITGPYGTTALWDNIADGEFVSDAYVRTGTDGYVAPRCS